MSYQFGRKSEAELRGVHPDLVAVMRRAIAISDQDFSIHDGLRTEAEQRDYVRRGVSKTMNSMHRVQADGFGHAVDAVPYIGGKLRWEWRPIFVIAAAVRSAAIDLKVPLVWGGVWDRRLAELGATPAELEKAVNAYVARRRGLGKTAFIDGPHYEIAR